MISRQENVIKTTRGPFQRDSEIISTEKGLSPHSAGLALSTSRSPQ